MNSGKEYSLKGNLSKTYGESFSFKAGFFLSKPVTATLVNDAKDYKYSAAKFYVIGLDEFGIIAAALKIVAHPRNMEHKKLSIRKI